ncbi:MAG: hypothetical protein IJK42_10835 [Prevotella sp.]|nr:hypothetical protein [Prevotella sp.]MBQ6210247.1 hypothetical protein [Prevotella sp.]
MNKREYQAPCMKIKCFTSEHPFMEWSDWGDAKKGQFIEDEELDNSDADNVWDNVWDYQ